jgi:PAS domain S-box-containing protein
MSGATNGGRAQSYEALRDSEELHRATLSSISDAVFMADDDGAFTYICPNVDVIFGYLPDEVRAMGRIERLLGAGLFDPAELAAKGEIRNVEREITSKSGESRVVLIQIKRVSIKGGTVLCTCRDVTDLKRAERQLAAVRIELPRARLALAGERMASIAGPAAAHRDPRQRERRHPARAGGQGRALGAA